MEEEKLEWASKIESYIKLNVDSIIIDFSQTNVPPDEAIIFLKNSKITFSR